MQPQLRKNGSKLVTKNLEKGLKTRKKRFFQKKLQKVLSKFGSLKNLPYLCTTFGSEIESEGFWKRFFDLLVIFKRENVVFICQFPLMENEVVRTLTIHYNFLQWRVWSWLRMNASGRLNTCKSRGSGDCACTICRRPAHGCVTRMQPTYNRGITLRNWY